MDIKCGYGIILGDGINLKTTFHKLPYIGARVCLAFILEHLYCTWHAVINHIISITFLAINQKIFVFRFYVSTYFELDTLLVNPPRFLHLLYFRYEVIGFM